MPIGNLHTGPARRALTPLFWRAGRFLLYVFAAIEAVSTPLEQRESEIVTLFLKYHRAATADEIATETKMEKVEVYYCLNVLLERGIIKVIDSRPQRWVLK